MFCSAYGGVRKLPSGRYQARATVRGRRQPIGTFRTRREAVAALGEASPDAVATANSSTTVAEACEMWWATRAGHRASTRARDRVVLDHDILPVLGQRQLVDVAPIDVQNWVNNQAATRAPSTVRRSFVVLDAALEAATEAGRLAANPAGRARLPKLQRSEMRFLTPEELEYLAEAIGQRWRAMVLVMAYATLRLGEAAGLRRVDVDVDAGTIRVANNVVEVSSKLHEGPPKTAASRRTMTLPASVMAELEEHLNGLQGQPGTGSAYTFPWDDGGPLRAGEWRRRFWHPAVRAAELAPLRPHDLKHSGVAFLAAASAGASEIARRAGHTDAGFTLRVYGHLLPGMDRLAAERLDALRSSVVDSSRGARKGHDGLSGNRATTPTVGLTWDNGSGNCDREGATSSTPYARRAG